MGDEIVAHQLESEDREKEEKNGKVAIVVTIDEELLKRIEASVHPDLATENNSTSIDGGDKGLHFIRNNPSG